MTKRNKGIMKVGLFVLFLMALASNVSVSHAEEVHSSDKTITVPQGKTVDNLFAIGQNATVDGHVRNLVLVVGGNLKIHSTAHVDELILVIGGNVTIDPGSYTTENIFSFAWNKRVSDALLFGGAVLLSSWLFKLIIAIFLILFATLASFWEPPSIRKHRLFGSWKLWLTGLITAIWLVVLVGILAFTIVGIPVALILLVIPVIAFFVLTGGISRELGVRLIPERNANWTTTILGAFLLACILGFPLFGLLFYLCLIVLSLGHLILWLSDHWNNRKRKKRDPIPE